MFKLAGHTMGTPEYTVPEALELFRKIGLQGAEIIVQDDYRCAIPTDASMEYLTQIRDCAQKNEIVIIALTPYNSRYNDLDDDVRDAEIEAIRKTIGYARFLGAKYVRIYGGNFPAGTVDVDGKMRKRLVEALRELGDMAWRQKVTLVVENHFNTMAVSVAQTVSLLEEIDHPAVGALYDQVNLTFTLQEEFEQAIEMQKKLIRYVHVKDLVFKEGRRAFVSSDVSRPTEEERNVTSKIVGEGITPWKAILQRLRDIGYDGWLSFEYERRWHSQDLPDASIGMAACVRNLRKCFPGT